ncbi:serpin family protein [Histomonas meleagridis]|uniref:serpin family protein n=1 Tax=Histomonas meleagridis TaxID=135588 RepID=UPI00355AB75A|nr:serpin family protein [Histomonas meleagridis]KAH0801289.1 serpin family protein [Histomonas meleagridis]
MGGFLSFLSEPSKNTRNSNKLAFDMFKLLAEPEKNNIVSPISIYIILSMTPSLFKGQTRSEIIKILKLDNDVSDEVIASELRTLIDQESRSCVNTYNQIWVNKLLNIPNSLFKCLDDVGIKIEQEIFPEPATSMINSAAKRATGGVIPKVVDNLRSDTSMVLINAIYFNSKWKTKFDMKAQSPNDIWKFTYDDSIPMRYMVINSINLPVANLPTFKMVCIPYQDDYSMVICLPYKITPPEITEEEFMNGINSMSNTKIRLIMPKFELSSDIDLIPVMKSLGMNLIFSENAECPNEEFQYYVTGFYQKAKIDVSETSTVAAAVSVLEFHKKSGGFSFNSEPQIIWVNHPFFFVIMNNSTNAILFAGNVYMPKSE